nr:hypothetical protein OG461_32265 [Streptomyces sp. NBC_00995]
MEAVSELLTGASRQLFEQPLPVLAMIQSDNAFPGDDGGSGRPTDEIIADPVLRTAGVSDPCAQDRRVVRILEQAWPGPLTTVRYERASAEAAQDGIRPACRLLLARSAVWSPTRRALLTG